MSIWKLQFRWLPHFWRYPWLLNLDLPYLVVVSRTPHRLNHLLTTRCGILMPYSLTDTVGFLSQNSSRFDKACYFARTAWAPTHPTHIAWMQYYLPGVLLQHFRFSAGMILVLLFRHFLPDATILSMFIVFEQYIYSRTLTKLLLTLHFYPFPQHMLQDTHQTYLHA